MLTVLYVGDPLHEIAPMEWCFSGNYGLYGEYHAGIKFDDYLLVAYRSLQPFIPSFSSPALSHHREYH